MAEVAVVSRARGCLLTSPQTGKQRERHATVDLLGNRYRRTAQPWSKGERVWHLWFWTRDMLRVSRHTQSGTANCISSLPPIELG